MFKKIGILILTIISTTAFSQTNSLYKIIHQKKYGYVDTTGSVKIEPKFNFALQFKEGLAAVREKDKYGFIDENGSYVIAPQYEMAESFNSGLAVVYLKGKPFAINKKNQKVIDTIYSKIEKFNNGFAHVCSKNNLWGVVDSLGKVVIKPTLAWGISFTDDYATIRKPIKQDDFDCYYAVINKKYQIVLPFDKYTYIQYLGNDLFFVNPKDGGRLIINKSGKTIFKEDIYFNYDYNFNFNEGLAIISIVEKPYTNQERSYSAIADTNGTIIFKDKFRYGGATRFKGNYAFAKQSDNLFWAINKKGEKKLIDSIESIDDAKSDNIFIYKNTNGHYGLIDGNANITVKAKYSWINYYDAINKFYFYEDISDSTDINGFIDCKGNVQYLDDSLKNLWRFTNDGLMYGRKEDTLALYNKNYKIVWQTILKNDSVQYLNTDIKYRTRYVQERRYDEGLDGNFYYFGNTIKSFPFNNEKNKVSFKLLTNATDTFINCFHSNPLYLFNNTKKDFNYLSIDFEAPIILQAKNEKGIWQDIATIREYMGHNTNTYMKSILRPNSYLKFSIPIFQGSFKTKLRVVFEYAIRDDKKYYYQWQTKKLYSNEMDVSINPSQFYNEGNFPADNQLGGIYEEYLLQ